MRVYHGTSVIVDKPEVRIAGYTKDFGYGFYCTKLEKQAQRWAKFKHPSHQVLFCNDKALQSLTYIESYQL